MWPTGQWAERVNLPRRRWSADEFLRPVGLSIKERPMTVLAVVGGLAFAAGALWMFKISRKQSRYDEVLATLSDLPRRAGLR